MTAPDYFAMSGVNWSSLKWLRESPAAYAHATSTPAADTDAFALGRALHCAVLEPDEFGARFVEWTGERRAGAKWEEFTAEHLGSTILRTQDLEIVRAMAQSVCGDPTASRYISGGVVEQPLRWADPVTGIACKAKPDLHRAEDAVLVDLKTTRSIAGRQFGAEASRYGYHLQLAHYEAAVTHALGWRPARALIVAVGKQPPYEVGVFEIDQVARDIAAQEVAQLLEKLRTCIDSNSWRGRYSEVQALQLPAWVYADDDEDGSEGLGLVLGGE